MTDDRTFAGSARLPGRGPQRRPGLATTALRAAMDRLAVDPGNPTLRGLLHDAVEACLPDAIRRQDRQALRSRVEDAPTFVLIGRALRALGRRSDAAAMLEAATRCDPGAPMPVFLLCATWLQDGDPRAAAMLGGLLARFPRQAEGWEEIGLVLANLGRNEAALICFRRAMQHAPSFGRAMRIGLLLRSSGRLAEAAAAFGQAADLDRTSVRARFMVGLCRQDLGDLAAAASAYGAVLRLDPAQAEAAVNLGTVLQDGGDLEAAKDAYRQALAARPDSFGRIAQAMTTSRRGELWLDLKKLRHTLVG